MIPILPSCSTLTATQAASPCARGGAVSHASVLIMTTSSIMTLRNKPRPPSEVLTGSHARASGALLGYYAPMINRLTRGLRYDRDPVAPQGMQLIRRGITPLYLAAQNGHLACCELLLLHGARPTQCMFHLGRGQSFSPRDVALTNLHFRVFALLVKAERAEREAREAHAAVAVPLLSDSA